VCEARPLTRSVAVVVDGQIVAVAPVAQGRFWTLVPRKTLRHTPEVYAIGR